jgi:hypothetical protein
MNVGEETSGTIKACPICNHRDGWEELDGMGTSRCAYCGARFLPTFSGVMYVGEWKDYACKSMFSPPIKERSTTI